VCVLPIDAVAALAGVSRSTCQNALRAGRRLGLIEVRERSTGMTTLWTSHPVEPMLLDAVVSPRAAATTASL